MNSNSFIRVQVRVQKKYFFEFELEFGKMIDFFRVRVRRSPDSQSQYFTSTVVVLEKCELCGPTGTP